MIGLHKYDDTVKLNYYWINNMELIKNDFQTIFWSRKAMLIQDPNLPVFFWPCNDAVMSKKTNNKAHNPVENTKDLISV